MLQQVSCDAIQRILLSCTCGGQTKVARRLQIISIGTWSEDQQGVGGSNPSIGFFFVLLHGLSLVLGFLWVGILLWCLVINCSQLQDQSTSLIHASTMTRSRPGLLGAIKCFFHTLEWYNMTFVAFSFEQKVLEEIREGWLGVNKTEALDLTYSTVVSGPYAV